MAFPRTMPGDVFVASVMICREPERFDTLVLLSASAGPWEAVTALPRDIAAHLTDEVGNSNPTGGGGVQIIEIEVLDKLERHGFFACFRAVHERWLDRFDTVPTPEVYEELRNDLVLLGWDVCTGNGWVPASFEGAFPIKAGGRGTAEYSDEAGTLSLNRWALFDSLEEAVSCCALNTANDPQHSPWYPVAVCTDGRSFGRLIERFGA